MIERFPTFSDIWGSEGVSSSKWTRKDVKDCCSCQSHPSTMNSSKFDKSLFHFRVDGIFFLQLFCLISNRLVLKKNIEESRNVRRHIAIEAF